MHKGEGCLNNLRISLAPLSKEGPFQVMFVATRRTQEQKKLKMCKLDCQNAVKKNVGLRRFMHSISLASDLDLHENIVSVSVSHEPFV